MSLTLDRPPPVARASHRRRPHTPAWLRLPWPLALILGVQIALSLRLVASNTAYIDEANYLYAGHQMWTHWIHGTPVVDYELYFSGSPALYPPIGAVADSLGGVVGARALGLIFVMGATTLLYLTTKSIFDRRAAFIATALFSSLGVTQFLSAFATYDPMALFLLALSGYLVIGRSPNMASLSNTILLTVIAPIVLALDNATKYATALWDPIMIGLAICAPVIGGETWRRAVGVGARFTATLAMALGFGLAIGKGKYIRGILYTTVARSSNNALMGQPPSLIFRDTWTWLGPLLVLILLGIVAVGVWHWRSPVLAACALCTAAAILAPLNQARIGTSTSLHKHIVFGAWFGCIVAAYGARKLAGWRPAVAVTVLSILAAAFMFYDAQAAILYRGWAKENMEFIQGVKGMTHPGSQTYLFGSYDTILAYYVKDIKSLQWKESEPGAYSFHDPGTGMLYHDASALDDAIKHRTFSLIFINGQGANNRAILNDIRKYGDYHIADYLPPQMAGEKAWYTVWALDGVSNP